MATYIKEPRNFFAAQSFLGKRDKRKLGHNTYMIRRADNQIAVRYHRTDVVTFMADGRIILNTGGWQTATTKDRLNAFTPAGVFIWQKDFTWYIDTVDGVERLFEDGMTIRDAHTGSYISY